MVDEIDIHRAAKLVLGQYEDDAEFHAWMRADSHPLMDRVFLLRTRALSESIK